MASGSVLRSRRCLAMMIAFTLLLLIVGTIGSNDANIAAFCNRHQYAFFLPPTSAQNECSAAAIVVGTNSKSAVLLSSTKKESPLPDYGNTSIDIDRHKLEKKKKWRRPDLFGNSLISQTLSELQSDTEFQQTSSRLKDKGGAAAMTREERTKRRRALEGLGVPPFHQFLLANSGSDDDGGVSLQRKTPKVLQINIGLYCNQACSHCHVESSPLRTSEAMSMSTVIQCLTLLKNTPSITTLDITGGAPELNANFRYLVSMARALRPHDLDIIDRCNLTVLQEPDMGQNLIDFLVGNRVHIIASLPCYSKDNVDQQRGRGVFERSIAGLLALNDAGYGLSSLSPSNRQEEEGVLQLDLVYNPLGAFLPPPQAKLQEKYKEELRNTFGIEFDHLFTMTNMPIKRFTDFLDRRGELVDYMDLLVRNFNKDTVDSLMCRDTISIGWDGKIYDCDFNQQLGYTIGSPSIHNSEEGGLTVFDISSLNDLQKYSIINDNHCFGCTAGMGSS